MRKYVKCNYCGRKIYENEAAIRRKGYIAFYCSYDCLAKDNRWCEVVTICDEILNEDDLKWDGVE